jgi:hypothetical protein
MSTGRWNRHKAMKELLKGMDLEGRLRFLIKYADAHVRNKKRKREGKPKR